MDPTTEQQILDQAMDAIRREAGLRLTLGQTDPLPDDPQYDAIVHLPDQGVQLFVEIKKWAQHINLGALIAQMNQMPKPAVLVADFINRRMAEKLRAADIQFIDTAGNTFLNLPPTYIYIRGNRPANFDLRMTGRPEAFGRAFTATGLKVVYAFLRDPKLVNAPYRDIAKATDTAVGTVGWVLYDLKADLYIADIGRRRGRRLIKYKNLLERWTEAYPEKLRPKQLIGVFTAPNNQWWKEIDIREFHAYWGGEIAGAKLTNYLIPRDTTIYVPEGHETNLITAIKLRRAPRDDINQELGVTYLYKVFWPDTDNRDELVDPVLTYTDLIATADTRNREIATMIFENYIAKRIQQN